MLVLQQLVPTASESLALRPAADGAATAAAFRKGIFFLVLFSFGVLYPFFQGHFLRAR